jgi:hypothetical protein
MISDPKRSATGMAKRTAWFERSEKSMGTRIFATGNMTASVHDLTADASQRPAGIGYPNRKEICMQLGMIGLGRMGANMVRRLMRGGHQCVVWDQGRANVEKLEGESPAAAAPGLVDDPRRRRGWLSG